MTKTYDYKSSIMKQNENQILHQKSKNSVTALHLVNF